MRVNIDEIEFVAEPGQLAVLRKLGVLDEDLVGLTYEAAEDWIDELQDDLDYQRRKARRTRERQSLKRRKEVDPQATRELSVRKRPHAESV